MPARFPSLLGSIQPVFLAFLLCSVATPSPAAQNVNLAWDPNAAPNIAGYRVYSGVSSGVYTQQLEVGTSTSVIVSNLVEGATYFFTVTDYDSSALESSRSNEVSYTV